MNLHLYNTMVKDPVSGEMVPLSVLGGGSDEAVQAWLDDHPEALSQAVLTDYDVLKTEVDTIIANDTKYLTGYEIRVYEGDTAANDNTYEEVISSDAVILQVAYQNYNSATGTEIKIDNITYTLTAGPLSTQQTIDLVITDSSDTRFTVYIICAIPSSSEEPSIPELADIRIGADGTTYLTAGDAVRGQVEKLNADIYNGSIGESMVLNHWVQGGLNTNTGANITANNRCRYFQYIDFGKYLSNISITPLAGYEYNLFEYGSNLSFIKYYGWTGDAKTFVLDTTHMYRIAISKSDQSDFTPSDVPSNVLTFVMHKKSSDIIEDITEESGNLFYITDLATGKVLNTGYGITITKNEDGSLTFNGTASTTFPIRLMGAIDDTVPNVLANTPYYVNREYLGSNELTKFPYFAYKDADHSSYTTLYKDRVYSFGSNPMLYLRIGGTYSFNNDTFRFTVTKGDVAQPYTNHESLVVNDPVYQYWKKEYKGNQDGNIFFNIKVDRPMPFDSENIVSQEQEIECVLRLPSTYTANGTPTRLVLCCHGSSGYVDKANNYWWHSNWNSFITALTDAGYACFDCNLYPTSVNDTSIVGEHYGSPLYVENCKKAYDYIVANYNVYQEIFVHGCSMGGVAATSFAHVYPQIVLAESSFAGRDFCLYIWRMLNLWTASEQLLFANAMGYDTVADLEADHLSHCAGYYPSLSLIKCEDGSLVLPPDRVEDFSSWMSYYSQLEGYAEDDDAGTWLGVRKIPYKAWNSWGDRVGDTKFETILEKAYNTGNSCVYYNVIYDSYTHTQMCYGQTADMNAQLIQFYKQFE